MKIHMKKIVSVLLTVLLVFGATGCSSIAQHYDAAGYISAMLKNSYQNDSADYISFASASEETALENYNATITRGINRFNAVFGLSLTDAQKTQLDTLIRDAYKAVRYTVGEQTELPSGYVVRVEVEPLTSFGNAVEEAFRYKKQLQADAATGTAGVTTVSELEERFAQHVLDACAAALQTPSYSENVTVVFEIVKDKTGNLSIDMLDFDRVDEAAILY